MLNNLVIKQLGLTDYTTVLQLQRRLQADLMRGIDFNTLILCRHNPIITLGRRGDTKNILVTNETLKTLGIEVIKIERGGDITLHTPEQIVCYPIINLEKLQQRGVHRYIYNLEETVIRTLAAFNINGIRLKDRTGVWLSESKKISSIGVRISKWCTLHGFALNVKASDKFKLINPCGFNDIQMTSISEETDRAVDFSEVENLIIKNFLSLFNFTPDTTSQRGLRDTTKSL
ncbi:MAG: lipoyl(octanoyl) transferase LipB [Bdellovibrionota bacterium]